MPINRFLKIFPDRPDIYHTEEVVCGVCLKSWVAVFPEFCEEVECPSCANKVDIFDE